MKNIRQTAVIVKKILESFPDTRSNDNWLYYEVCAELNPDALDETLGDVLTCMPSYYIPPFETVRRARQKIQRRFPELAGSEEIRKARKELEREMRKYAGE